jgi:hypothetical protein
MMKSWTTVNVTFNKVMKQQPNPFLTALPMGAEGWADKNPPQ